MTRTQSSKWDGFQFMKCFLKENRELEVYPEGYEK